jgi:hypothetical protein
LKVLYAALKRPLFRAVQALVLHHGARICGACVCAENHGNIFRLWVLA